jgi:hypothetical protein
VRVKFCAQNQPLNVNIDKVMIILRPDLGPAKKKSPFGFFRSGLLDMLRTVVRYHTAVVRYSLDGFIMQNIATAH